VTDLAYGKTYYYAVGADTSGWSADLVFNMVPPPSSPLRLAVFGDLGYNNSVCLSQLLNRTLDDSYDTILHVGDMAYDLFTNNALLGDEWMRAVEPMASRVPYMVCPGNHEADHYGSFHNYMYRFRMPHWTDTQNLWFSWQLGPVYFVAVSTEAYFFPAQMTSIPAQWQWLDAELARANAQRDAYPWLVVYGHRPMYCSDRDSSDYSDCTADTDLVRDGLLGRWGLEDLLYKYGVDLYLCGHEHSYERLWPVYQSRVYNGSLAFPYTDPPAPVHIISGAAGNQEQFDVFGPAADWSAFRSSTYGFGELTVYNATVAQWRQILADGTLLDEINVVKHTHGPYPPPVPRA
jgi:3',5'-cyclic AMP phosphodiesterase CpdA